MDVKTFIMMVVTLSCANANYLAGGEIEAWSGIHAGTWHNAGGIDYAACTSTCLNIYGTCQSSNTSPNNQQLCAGAAAVCFNECNCYGSCEDCGLCSKCNNDAICKCRAKCSLLGCGLGIFTKYYGCATTTDTNGEAVVCLPLIYEAAQGCLLAAVEAAAADDTTTTT